ncbi:Endonuclease/exonuclease/phosphatase [Coemansia spiralis]|nr:Endonuclease/exonuclease/phosphatase [Coemansia spiralis]
MSTNDASTATAIPSELESLPNTVAERVSNPTKEAWILHSLKKRKAEFVHSYKINAFVGTWNVNGQAPADTQALADWLGFVPKDTNNLSLASLPELLVLGFQELDVRAEAFVYNNAVKDLEWTEAIEKCMGDTRYSFCKLASKQLIGMFIMVYARLDVAELVSGIQTASVGCGIMGMVGNKGAVGVRFIYRDTPLCFVCSHLAHDALQMERRNAQFHDICKRLTFGVGDDVAADPLIPKSFGLHGSGNVANRQPTVFDHSYLFWFGDLNYRLAIDTGDIGSVVARGEHKSLLGLDQLRITMMNKQAFVGFEEADIDFKPTYKYVVGTSVYDAKRRPAWCDRVLWWTRPGCEDGIQCKEYTSIDNLTTSDHKPVRSQLGIDVWKVDTEQRQSIYLDVLRELDRYENECIPTATLENTVVDFGEVSFGRAVRRKMSLANSGQVPLEYSFAETPSRDGYAPPWLGITPNSGMLLPGETILLELVVLVDEQTSAPLNSRVEDLCDILVLHLERGRDYFIQVQGDYKPSVYGMSLDILVHCKKPVRNMSREDFEQCLSSGQFSVPKCIWSMTDFLSRYAVERGYSLFYWAGEKSLARKIKECLDTDAPLDPDSILQWSSPSEEHMSRTAVEDPTRIRIQQRVDTVASCLIDLFRSIPEPLVPLEMYTACIEAGGISRAAALEALEDLAPGNLNILVYLLAFLREAIEQGATSAQRVAQVFSRVLLRPPPDRAVVSNDNEGAESFLLFLLRSHGHI